MVIKIGIEERAEMNSTNNQKEKLKCKVEDEENLWREGMIKSVSSSGVWKTLCC